MKLSGVIACFLVCLAFVSAAHVILTSSGTSIFSASSSISNFFNFSVQVTDTSAAGNVTQVQVSLPSNFSFTSSSEGTDAGGSFSSGSSTLTWTNSTGLVMNQTTNNFWFNASISWPGQYNLSIATTNASGTYYSNLSVNVSDGSPPVLSFVSPGITEQTNSTGSTVSVNISASDYGSIGLILIRLYNSSGQINSSSTYGAPSNYIQFSGLPNGVYKVNASSNDSLGNLNYSSTMQVILDSTGPSVSISLIEATSDSLNVSISASDSLTGISGTCSVSGQGEEEISGNGTSQSFYVDGLDCGDDFEYTVTCRDRLNNAGEDSDTFSTSSCQSSGAGTTSGSGGGTTTSEEISEDFWTATVDKSESEFEELTNFTVILEEHERVKVKLAEDNYYIGVVDISADSAKLLVGSEQKTIEESTSAKFDFNDDKYYDVLVSVKSVDSGQVEIEASYIHESTQAFGVEANSKIEGKTLSKAKFLIIGVIVLILAGVGFLLYRFRFSRKVMRRR